MVEYLDALHKYLPGVASSPTLTQGWAAAKVFEKALSATVGEPATAAQVLEGLWSFKNETIGGITPPLTFVRDQPAPLANCWFYVAVKDGKMTAPQGITPVCR